MVDFANSRLCHRRERREVNGRTALRVASLGNVPLTRSRSRPGLAGVEMAANRIRPEGRNSIAKMPSIGTRHSICMNPSGLIPISGSGNCRSPIRKSAIPRSDSISMRGSSGSSSAKPWRYPSLSATFSSPNSLSPTIISLCLVAMAICLLHHLYSCPEHAYRGRRSDSRLSPVDPTPISIPQNPDRRLTPTPNPPAAQPTAGPLQSTCRPIP